MRPVSCRTTVRFPGMCHILFFFPDRATAGWRKWKWTGRTVVFDVGSGGLAAFGWCAKSDFSYRGTGKRLRRPWKGVSEFCEGSFPTLRGMEQFLEANLAVTGEVNCSSSKVSQLNRCSSIVRRALLSFVSDPITSGTPCVKKHQASINSLPVYKTSEFIPWTAF
jgi:hypothetical protein